MEVWLAKNSTASSTSIFENFTDIFAFPSYGQSFLIESHRTAGFARNPEHPEGSSFPPSLSLVPHSQGICRQQH